MPSEWQVVFVYLIAWGNPVRDKAQSDTPPALPLKFSPNTIRTQSYPAPPSW